MTLNLVGLACFGLLLWSWRAGDLTAGSFWILSVTLAIELGIWAFLRHGFNEYRDDPVRLSYVERRAELWRKSAQKGRE